MKPTSTPKSLDLHAGELALVADEGARLLVGQRFSRIVEASERCLLFQGGFTDLAVDLTPGFVHACLCGTRRARGEVGPFTMLLRKHIGGARVTAVRLARPGDRILQIEFTSGVTLSCELSGRHANAFLLDDAGVILGAWFPTHSVTRPLHVGATYELPPPPRPAEPGAPAATPLSRFPAGDTGAAVDAYFTAALREAARERARATAIAARTRELERARRTLDHLRTDAERMARRTEGKRLGDLFLAALPVWPAGAVTFEFTPWDGSPPETLTLPARCKTPAAAAQFHFGEYKKARRSRAVVEERAAHFAALAAHLEAELAVLAARPAETFDAPAAAAGGKPARGGKSNTGGRPDSTGKKSKQPATDAGTRAFVSSDGLPIEVGKSATDNHRLTFQKARGADVWLHARDVPGSHTVIFCGNGPVPRRTLEEAAMLALFYSDARPEGRGDVHWVQRKFVHAVRGAPGKVTLASPKSLFVVIDPAVIERLFASRDAG